MVKKYFPFLITFFFSVIASYSLFHRGLIPTHDGEYHVVRFYEFDKVLREGVLYPRWAPDLNKGYGLPLFNYVYPFPNYFASFLHLFGISFIDTFKFNMFFATVFGALFFYLWAKEYWGKIGGVVSAIFFVYSPYRFVDVFIRGSVGEVWAMAFFPAFLWSIKKLQKNGENRWISISSLFLALIIFSHNILGLMFFSFSIFYVLFLLLQSKDRLFLSIAFIKTYLLGLAISSIFWFPALFETKYVTGLQIYDIKENFAEIYQLIFPSWGSGFSTSDPGNQMSLQIGVANLLVIVGSMCMLFLSLIKRKKNSLLLIFFLGSFFVIFFLMLSWSWAFWKIIPLMSYFQFPWRFLSLEIIICSFLAGGIAFFLNSKIVTAFLLCLPFLLGISYTHPAYFLDRQDSYYVTKENFIDGTNSPGNYFNTIWMNSNLQRRRSLLLYNNDSFKIKELKTFSYEFESQSELEREVTVNIAYFPGWLTYIDGKVNSTNPNKDGLITFFVPKGNHNVKLYLSDTSVRSIAFFVSIFSVCITLILLNRKSYVTMKG